MFSNIALAACAAICCVGSFAGAKTLQERIDETPAGGTLTLEAGTYAGQVTITKPMTLAAADPEATIIDGGGTNRCLKIESSNVTVSGIGFWNGLSGQGGGIEAIQKYSGEDNRYTNVTVSSCVFSNCQATATGAGAVSEIHGLVADCLFVGNAVTGWGGGGAARDCDLMERCVFRGNSAPSGGAVSDCTVRFSLFVGNNARL